MTDTLSLDDVSVLLVWTAIAVYALAFVAYAIDLARRSALAVEAKDARARDRELVAAGGESITDVTARERRAEAEIASAPGARPRLLWTRIGTSLTVLAFLFHLGATVLRGIAAERVPWSNMYEFAMTGLLLVVAVYFVPIILA